MTKFASDNVTCACPEVMDALVAAMTVIALPASAVSIAAIGPTTATAARARAS